MNTSISALFLRARMTAALFVLIPFVACTNAPPAGDAGDAGGDAGDSGAVAPIWKEVTFAATSGNNAQYVTSSADGSHLAIAVNNGGIWTSSNSGTDWVQQALGIGTRNWADIASSADGTFIAAVVNGGDIFTSSNSGEAWANKTPASGPASGSLAWAGIAVSAKAEVLAGIVGGGHIYTSTDKGTAWFDRSPTTGPGAGDLRWTSIATSALGDKLVAVFYGGQIFTSTNSGTSWAPSGTPGINWRAVASSKDGNVLAAVSTPNGLIAISNNAAVTWNEQYPAGKVNPPAWSSIAASGDGNRLVAVARNGQIYISPDAGKTWKDITPTTGPGSGGVEWVDVASSDDGNKLVLAATQGRVFTLVLTY